MRILSVLMLTLAVFAACLAAEPVQAAETVAEAERLIDSGRYTDAETMLRDIIRKSPKNARAHQLLGDAYKRQSRFEEALAEYGRALELGGPNAELYKSIGTVNKWSGNRTAAEEAYKKALELKPGDREAAADLDSLTLSRGLDVTLMAGGWEPDYTTSAYEVMLKYGGVDKYDLYAGYGFADQVYYDRTKLYAKAYYFFAPGNYFKVNPQYKDYDYPVSKVPVPDSNSYDKVPSVEFELQYWATPKVRTNLIYEFFRPSFFHDPDSHANNHKFTGELYFLTSHDWLRYKVFLSVLRDPDPDNTTIKGRGGAASTNVDYQLQALLGGAVEMSWGRWDGEIKYMPNRDLDSSYEYSLLAGVRYAFTDKLSGRFDIVHDRYSSQSNFSGSTANVYLASAYYKFTPSLDAGVGYKYLDLPAGKDSSGFLILRYRTGKRF